ncbi:MAG: hypothetical protein AB1649_14275 [Chloroflexota bacterium]
MLNEPRVYRHPPYQLVLAILAFGILAGVFFFSFQEEALWIILPLGILLVFLLIFSVFMMTSKTIISDTDISVQNIFGTKSLTWSEINRVSGRYYGIKLHNFDGDVTVSPSPQLPGYEEIIEWIGAKRPDLFAAEENEPMSRSWFIILVVAIFVILIVGIATLSIVQTEQWFLSLFFAFVGAMILFIVAGSPQSIVIEGRSILLKYILSQKTLLAGEIESVQLVSQRTRNGKTYHVQLNLPSGKRLRISSLSPSLPIVYLRLKTWHRKHTGDIVSPARF